MAEQPTDNSLGAVVKAATAFGLAMDEVSDAVMATFGMMLDEVWEALTATDIPRSPELGHRFIDELSGQLSRRLLSKQQASHRTAP